MSLTAYSSPPTNTQEQYLSLVQYPLNQDQELNGGQQCNLFFGLVQSESGSPSSQPTDTLPAFVMPLNVSS